MSTAASYSANSNKPLYRRITAIGDPKISVIPVLDQWVNEGNKVDERELRVIITEMTVYNRFKHALEISQWMSDKRYIPLSPEDAARRLKLIYRVYGIDKSESYYDNIPKQLKSYWVHSALLKCYAQEKSVEKAEALFRKLSDLGLARSPYFYNLLLDLYYKMGNFMKFDKLRNEMKENGICGDRFTYTIQLSAYAASRDIQGMDDIVSRMELDSRVDLNWSCYAIAADGYAKCGLQDKVMEMLKKLEGILKFSKKKNEGFNFLLKIYGDVRKKDELYRIWNLYKLKQKIYNKGYINMITSVLNFDDIEGAEMIFEEWEMKELSHDFRVPNLLIEFYCKNGCLEKAEALIDKGILKGGNPTFRTWYHLAGGYLKANLVSKAKEALKKAISICSLESKPSKGTLSTCLGYLEGKGNVEEAEEFISLLRVEGAFSDSIHNIILGYIKDENVSD